MNLLDRPINAPGQSGLIPVATKQQSLRSCLGTAHFDLRLAQRGFSSAHRGIHKQSIFKARPAAARKCLRLFNWPAL
jgi:hypothetical protein